MVHKFFYLHKSLTNSLIKRCKSLGKEQRNRYIELGKICQECNTSSKTKNDASESDSDSDSDTEK